MRSLRFIALLLLCSSVLPGTAPVASAQGNIISSIRVIGNRRIPKETVLARLFSRENENYDPATVERDFNSLWNTGYFEDVRIEREDTPKGVVLDIYVHEKPTIREINYKGLNSITQSDILDAYKKAKVSLAQESQFDQTHIAQAITVIKELESEHGHQFASVREDVKVIPPSSVQLNFTIKEGPKVKVGNITFTGNEKVPSRILRASMKNLKPIGVPHSIVLENLFAKTYDATKLEEDTERVRQAYRDRGYFRANTADPDTHIRNEGGLSLFTFRPKDGKRMDIHIPVEEGGRYRFTGITFSGSKININTKALRAQFQMKDGDWFDATAFGKGLKNLNQAYNGLGYINFSPVPTPKYDDVNHTLSFNIDLDEGKQFKVSRIEFTGNKITRDFVIRREILLEEGQVYNSKLWEAGLQRLNQLEYFDPLKVDQDTETHQNAEAGTVDLLLKVHEKGKNSIGLNGGVSGLSGSFLGLNYQTNNFLGLGETLSVQASQGNLARNLSLGFNEPYVRNKPIDVGFQLFSNKTDYNSNKAYNVTGLGANAAAATNSLQQNYNQSSTGFSLSASYPLRRSFKRVGLTYSWDRSAVTAFSGASQNLFQTLAFRSGIQGQNALTGIITSKASFSYSYNHLDSNFAPRSGSSLQGLFQIAGLYGNVRYILPTVEYKSWHPMRGYHIDPQGRNALGIRLQASYVQGISGDVAPPFQRFYTGGESDLRGFDIRSGTPYGFIPTRVLFNLNNPDGTCVTRQPGAPQTGQCVQVPLPVYGIASAGGDTSLVNNIEYRIPLVGRTAALELFNDFGINVALNKNQLRQSPEGIATLDSPLYGCRTYVNGSCQGGVQIPFDNNVRPIYGTNFVPRDSIGAQISVLLPIVNAPFRIYYAYNPLRLDKSVASESTQLITRELFPQGSAGDFTYAQAVQLYGALYQLREPAKTFRLTVGTTF
ncbi:outer membrane protein assembly factor BamA [Acidipila sp. EB88]|uniref:outer membrane protein assembly factor BamA n=1 Tax=Acidipila sp. EB88 TaxID=2305226 RepID=UPI000F5E22BE|nr:outer membrane protein assembly factor BamA [Acidipila sp. EB88]RRA48049.1 outer membrane protein assembly factor BamA [Acidipila sp. EB88]